MMELNKKEIALLKVAVASYGQKVAAEMTECAKSGEWETYTDLYDLDDDLTELFNKLKADMLDTASGKMYFAEYKGVNSPTIAMFGTAAERDAWVNFKDAFSVETGTPAEDCTYERVAITGADAVEYEKVIRNNGADLTVKLDADVDGLVWIDITGGEM